MSASVSVLLALLLATQGTAPLRKSDFVRLLSGSAMSPVELAQLVRRNCLTFQPTDRDRGDFQRLGADPSLLAAVDDCARRSSARAAHPPAPVRVVIAPPPAAQPPVPQPRRVGVSAERRGRRALANDQARMINVH